MYNNLVEFLPNLCFEITTSNEFDLKKNSNINQKIQKLVSLNITEIDIPIINSYTIYKLLSKNENKKKLKL